MQQEKAGGKADAVRDKNLKTGKKGDIKQTP